VPLIMILIRRFLRNLIRKCILNSSKVPRTQILEDATIWTRLGTSDNPGPTNLTPQWTLPTKETFCGMDEEVWSMVTRLNFQPFNIHVSRANREKILSGQWKYLETPGFPSFMLLYDICWITLP